MLRAAEPKDNREFHNVNCRFCGAIHDVDWANISVLSQVRILYVNEKEKRYKRNIMFLFAGHFDKPLKSLISIAHKENNICLYRFSFIYVTNDL